MTKFIGLGLGVPDKLNPSIYENMQIKANKFNKLFSINNNSC